MISLGHNVSSSLCTLMAKSIRSGRTVTPSFRYTGLDALGTPTDHILWDKFWLITSEDMDTVVGSV